MQPKLLIKWASDLRRRIYASLPWGLRLGIFLRRLSSSIIDAFGRVMYAEFVKRGVVGMPDIGGQPAASWREKLEKAGTRAGDMVPRGTGREFAQKAWRILLSTTRNPSITEEVMTTVIEKFIKSPNLIQEGSTLRFAEGYVIQALKSHFIDYDRSERRRTRLQGPSLTVEDDSGEDVVLDVEDPDSWKQIGGLLSPVGLREIHRELERIHPSAAAFVDLSFQGYTPIEMARGAMLPHLEGKPTSPSNVYQWIERWKPRIQEVIQKHIDHGE
jgi:DNA-directed RNA polymerase specialized sigma24 family protein